MAKVIRSGAKSPKFDKDKSYRWEPTDTFEVSGQQFAMIYHALTQEVNNPAGASLAQKYEAFQVMMEIFKEGVEQGVIVESAVEEARMADEDPKIHSFLNPK